MAAGIPSTTIARRLIAIDRGEPGGLDDRTVLVIDEGGTAGTRDLARLLGEVHRTGAKAVLVGDPKQLPDIAASGLFAALTERLPVLELRDDRRQQHEWEIEALRQLRDGTTHALHACLRHDRITVGYDSHHTKMLLLGDWWASTVQGDDAVMLAGRRADVAELNACGHVRAEAAGYLDGPTLEVGGVPMRAGDKVMMLRNDTRIGVRNGNRGVILDVDADQRTMRVRLPRGEVDLPTRYLDAGNVGLAYAITVNKAHGMTCDATMMLADDLLYRELAYEALSRGRKENRIYMSRTTTAELDLQLEDGPHAPRGGGRRPARHPRRRPRTSPQQATRPRQHLLGPTRCMEHERPRGRTTAHPGRARPDAAPTEPPPSSRWRSRDRTMRGSLTSSNTPSRG